MRSLLPWCMCGLLAAGCAAAGRPPATAPRATGQDVSTSSCSGFALSLALDRGGQATPLAAAQYFAARQQRTWHSPKSGWYVSGQSGNGVSVRSGKTTLHTVQGSDQTWQVDSGKRC
jgi:hypothetical protein